MQPVFCGSQGRTQTLLHPAERSQKWTPDDPASPSAFRQRPDSWWSAMWTQEGEVRNGTEKWEIGESAPA